MERLETWDDRHGRPLEKTKDAVIITTAAVGITVGFAAAVVAVCALESWLQEQGGTRNYRGPDFSPYGP